MLDISKDILFLIFSSLCFRFLLDKCGQKWIKTISHTSTLTILPIITYVITKVISGNIALSLGMVGALSIVRFRNPVRSPLELTVYFAAITMGIASSVSLRWLFLLISSIFLSSFILFLIKFLSKKYYKNNFFITSFSEGNSLSTLEIKSSASIPNLDKSNLLKSKYSTSNSKNYVLASNDFDSLKKISYDLENNDLIKEYQLNE